MRWHFDILRKEGEIHVFRPKLGDGVPTRDVRQSWLRQTLLSALPVYEHKARKLVGDVTPHSFHAGLAGDLFREGLSLQTIGSVCRWNSSTTIRMYAERSSMSTSRTSGQFRILAGARE